MKKIDTPFKDLFILEPSIYGDQRGYFFESYHEKKFHDLGLNYHFVQDNESYSSYGTLRGLHFQKGEFAQAKLVRVVLGKVLDVVVDLREDSSTFGKHFSVELSDENKGLLLIPRGFAHGFVVLSKTAIFQYKCDNYYSPAHEGGIAYNDPHLGIDWKVSKDEMILSKKDQMLPYFGEIFSHRS